MSERSKSESYGDRPKLVDVARACGVSPATVSNALSGHRPVDGETRRRVIETALALGYTPNPRASRLRSGGADAIAIFSSMPVAVSGGPARMSFLMEVAGSAAAEALQGGMALVLVPPVAGERPMAHELPIDGAIVIEPRADDPVAIGRHPGADTPFIDLRSSETTRMMLEHLHDCGARRIAIMVGQQERTAQVESEAAYRAFAEERGIPLCIIRVPEMGGEAAAFTAATDCLNQDPSIDAIYAGIDTMAVGALEAAKALGRRVPSDLRLATRYDGVRARECEPQLTAFDLHLPEVAAAAVKLVLDHIRGHRTVREVAAPLPRLVVRGSTRSS